MSYDEQRKNILRAEVVQALMQFPRSLLEGNNMASALSAPVSLLMTESDPLLFLFREENINIQWAAFKLALSWSKRLSYFGPTRAFLPMNQSGLGTLTPQDVAALDHSCMQQLPHDAHGHGVFMITASKIETSLNSHGFPRALFYQLHSAHKTRGVVLLFLAPHAPGTESLKLFFSLLSDIINQALPLKVIQVHMLFPPHLTNHPSGLLETLALRLIIQQCLSSRDIHVMQATSPQEIADTLERSFGLTKQGLPPFLGGTLGQAAMHGAHNVTESGGQVLLPSHLCLLEPKSGLSPIDHSQMHLAARLDAANGSSAPSCIEANGSNPLPNALVFKRKAPPGQVVHDRDSKNKKVKVLPITGAMASIQGQEKSDDDTQNDDDERAYTRPPPSTASQDKDSDKKMPAKRAASTGRASMTVSIQGHEKSEDDMQYYDETQTRPPSTASQDQDSDKKMPAKRTGSKVVQHRHEPTGVTTTTSAALHPQHQQESAVANEQADDEAEDDAEKRRTKERERNALYSRRKYHKKKIEIEVMNNQAYRLQTQKSALLQEQKRLEQLYANAQQCIRMYHETCGFVAVAPQQDQGDQAQLVHAAILASAVASASQSQHHAPAQAANSSPLSELLDSLAVRLKHPPRDDC